MVFVYGGGWTIGSASLPLYAGDGLAPKGAVVVSFNYRVGHFGFFAFPELTRIDADHGLRGNYGQSGYHGLQANYRRKLAGWFMGNIGYTWGKSLAYGPADSTQSFAEASMQDPTNLRNSYGPKQGDLRHRFVGVYSIEIPTGGFARSGVSKAAFGAPVSARSPARTAS
jgi:hypothetical protein